MSSIYDLPQIDFVEKDTGTIRNNIITTYEALSGKTLYPGDPVRLFLETIASIIVQQRILIDSAAKQNTLRYAKGEYLEHIGALVGILRGQATKALTTLRFTISEPRPEVIAIAKGTRVALSNFVNQIYFQTLEYSEVKAGDTYVDVKAECMTEGELGNSYLPGQINQIVDPFPYFDKVENITESSGGADEEDDETYRQRIYEAPEAFSIAGPEGAYISLAKRASTLINDVAVRSPSAGVVEITPLVKDGDTTEEILNQVLEACSAKEVRPLTDNVIVRAPENVVYNIDLTYYISQENETIALSIQNEVMNEVENFIIWQREKLGRNINPSELIKRVMQAGAGRVVISQPDFKDIESYQVAVCNSLNIVYGGVENE